MSPAVGRQHIVRLLLHLSQLALQPNLPLPSSLQECPQNSELADNFLAVIMRDELCQPFYATSVKSHS